jgi:hypothetical protein
MKLASSALVFTLFCLPLLAQISSPKIGIARYPDGSFHTIQGLPDNMIVAELPLDAADAASFSDSGGIISQNGTIRLLGPDFAIVAEYPVPEKPLLSIDGDLTSALAWLPNSHTLLHWNGSTFDSLGVADSDLEGTVTDLQSASTKQARLIVLHPDKSVSRLTISLRSGNLVSSEPLPGVMGYTVGQAFFFVFTIDKELVIDNLHGYRRSVAMPASDLQIERMSNFWLHLYSPSLQQNWALHLTQADLKLSMLPGLPDQTHLAGVK